MTANYGRRRAKREKRNPLIEATKKLLEVFVDDVEKGIDPKEAGWLDESNIPPEVLQSLHDIIEQEKDKVKISLKPLPENIREAMLSEYGDEALLLLGIHEELQKAIKVAEDVTNLIKNSELQPAEIFLGWRYMLKTSIYPVVTDWLLKNGFTLDDWPQYAQKSSEMLAFKVVTKLYQPEKIIENLSKLSKLLHEKKYEKLYKKLYIININNRIYELLKVLKWNLVVETLDECEIVSLGLLWFADLHMGEFVYPETQAYLQRNFWKTIEDIIGLEGAHIREKIISKIKVIEEKTSEGDKLGRRYPIANWHMIIRIPW